MRNREKADAARPKAVKLNRETVQDLRDSIPTPFSNYNVWPHKAQAVAIAYHVWELEEENGLLKMIREFSALQKLLGDIRSKPIFHWQVTGGLDALDNMAFSLEQITQFMLKIKELPVMAEAQYDLRRIKGPEN